MNAAVLQRSGARVFFSSMSAGLEEINCRAGIPLHDGWVFEADNSDQAGQVVEVFQSRTRDILGASLPLKLTAVSQ